MTLANLTDPAAVTSAIAEFDRLGRGAFLKQYGYRPARNYFVSHSGQLYDSKAIVGVALGFQSGGPGLKAQQFSGGETTVAKALRKLGFEVVVADRPVMHWAFCANPARYRILDAVQGLEIDSWSVGNSDVRAGDMVLIWQTMDAQKRRGVVAFGRVITDPVQVEDSVNPFWTHPREGSSVSRRVKVRYFTSNALPIWEGESEGGEIAGTLSVAKSRGGTVFRVTNAQWEKLTAVCGNPSHEEDEIKEVIRPRTRSGGQGFSSDPVARRAIELHAMQVVREHLCIEWPVIEDVSETHSFDMLCRNDDEQLMVEVKGTTGNGCSVILTRNEVALARRERVALFVVAEIIVVRNENGTPSASGGKVTKFDPWSPLDGQLTPLAYSYLLPTKEVSVS